MAVFETLSVLTPQFLHEQLWPQEHELDPLQPQVDPQSQAMMADARVYVGCM